jgi:hypothetical protein
VKNPSLDFVITPFCRSVPEVWKKECEGRRAPSPCDPARMVVIELMAEKKILDFKPTW